MLLLSLVFQTHLIFLTSISVVYNVLSTLRLKELPIAQRKEYFPAETMKIEMLKMQDLFLL